MAKLDNVLNINPENKVILITGGYGYLGKAITESLVNHGALVFVLGRSKDKFEEVFEKNSFLNKKLFFQLCDISNTESIQNAFEKINSERKIDVLINNAFYLSGQSPETMNDDEWGNGIDGTLNSVFRCIREIIPFLKSNGNGKIINVSSMYGVVAPDFEVYEDSPQFLNPPHYGAAKAGVLQLTKYYSSFLGKWNIKVNAVTPGAFPSKKVQADKKFVENLKKKSCLNQIGNPEDLAGIFTFLSSEASNFITGQNFIVDGGWTVK
ncbi:SDR family oxidoreductase [Salegentibacter mishustinae]|uniref:SDR family oxidoreductase n=1 Tax=Salegentibacter mishustinae TaxID=270918 RepID=UPI0024932FAB|nr:SDR family oxidoreductase [Salegentibacter mishustinae]